MAGAVLRASVPTDPMATGASNATAVGAVLFDVDGTLYRQRPLRALMAAELAMSLPLRLPSRGVQVTRALRAYRHAQERLRDVCNHDESIEGLQFRQAARQSGVPEQQVRSAVSEWMLDRPLKYLRWCRRPGLLPLLEALHRRGVRLGVLSDYPCAGKLKALEIDGYFSLVLCAGDPEINTFKPNPRGFWRACETWNLPPEKVLYVGDRPEVDAVGANAAGVRCAIVGSRSRGVEADHRYRVARRLADIGRFVDAG